MKSFDFEKISVEDARKAYDGEAKHAKKADHTAERARDPSPVLQDTTVAWIAELPIEVRPLALARQFPRIANGICDMWRRVARCEEYLEALVVDRRGDRGGFPADVAQELTALKNFYAELHPSDRSTWDLVERSK
ncbi:MAG: hypothetical protein ABI724_00955 [Betaproteobacteria bacterium]